MEWINEFSVPVIVGICLCVGHIIKHSLDFIPNKYIPLIMGVLGMGLNIVFSVPQITAQTVLSGLFSGLSSTGVHNLVRQLTEP